MTNEQLVLRIRAGEDTAANMVLLYDQNRGMIAKLAYKYQHQAEFDDLMQEGYFGLCNAIDAWNPDEGVTFLHYATFWIKQAMLRYIDNNGSSIRIPVHKRSQIRKYQQIRQQYFKILNREPEDWELRRLMDISQGVLDQIKKNAYLVSIGSLDKCVGEEEDITLGEMVADPKDEYEDVLDQIQKEELKATIWPMVDTLEGQQPAVIRMRYQDNMTLKEVGEVIGVTYQYVRDLQAKALHKLRLPKYTDTLRTFVFDEEIRSKGIRGTGVQSFRRTWTSATERAAIELVE